MRGVFNFTLNDARITTNGDFHFTLKFNPKRSLDRSRFFSLSCVQLFGVLSTSVAVLLPALPRIARYPSPSRKTIRKTAVNNLHQSLMRFGFNDLDLTYTHYLYHGKEN